MMSLDAGEMVGDRYRIVKLLGQGGMGAVYRAWDTRLNRPVALKEMIPQLGLDEDTLVDLRHQFKQEAQILATLTHSSLVRVTDYFSWNDNEYLVMDFVEGESLADLICREGAQPETQVLQWASQLLDALTYCHKRGVLHRDIKPQNIIITPEGLAVLVDFGLVKLWDPNDPQTRTVMRGAGTPEYAPPEQYDMGMGHTDPRSDIYGLGATLYQIITGQVPPTATQRMASPASFLPPRHVNAAISPAVETAVLKALEIAMDNRFQTAEEMKQALQAGPDSRTAVITPAHTVSESSPAAAIPHPSIEIPAPQKRGRGVVIGLVIIGLLCLGAAAVVIVAGLSMVGSTPTDNTPAVTPSATSFVPVTYPTNTPAPRPSDTPAPPPNTPRPQAGSVLLRDDFDSSDSGWEIGDYDTGDVGYKDGIYFVTSDKQQSTMWGVAYRSFDNISISVNATQFSAGPDDNNSYGVICREQGNGDGYYLRISGDGFYSIMKAVDGDFESLVDWTSSSAIQEGNAANHIRAVCSSSTLSLYVNDQFLATVEDSTFAEGDIALTATTYEEEATEIHFDDLVVEAVE
ncbi:MAG TPA: serine/threonine protein kinase [Chloroflexi bacterium]|nr:serine/threonine protein kinase [Chloroflexota bacterium]